MMLELKELIENHNSTIVKKRWMRSKELKEIFKLSDSQIQVLRINGTLPYSKIGKTYYYDYELIKEILKENSVNPKGSNTKNLKG